MMLSKQFLTDELRRNLDGVRASCGFTLEDILRSGVKNPDSNIGAYAGDADCYEKFATFFDPIIESYHGFPIGGKHSGELDSLEPGPIPNLDPSGERIISTRIRVARNVNNAAFPPAISKNDRIDLEQRIVRVLKQLDGDIAGEYYPLANMDEDTQTRLTLEHFLFKKGDRFLEAAGVNRDWPSGRGIFHSADKKFLIWVNEEDHLRIISMQQGGDLEAIFERLSRGIAFLEKELEFACSDRLGYLTSCPTNLGTAMRASVHIKLPQLGQRADFKELCNEMQLSVRGVHGEHSESEGGVWDISNKQRLGITDSECIRTLHDGVKQLLSLEESA